MNSSKNGFASAFSPYILKLYETKRSRDTQAADREKRAFEDIRDYIEQA